MAYQVGVYAAHHGPQDTDPQLLATRTVLGLWKQPGERDLIVDEGLTMGGTWFTKQVVTSRPTRVATFSYFTEPPAFDKHGHPQFAPKPRFELGVNHVLSDLTVLSGTKYYSVVQVVDEFGNWEVRVDESKPIGER